MKSKREHITVGEMVLSPFGPPTLEELRLDIWMS